MSGPSGRDEIGNLGARRRRIPAVNQLHRGRVRIRRQDRQIERAKAGFLILPAEAGDGRELVVVQIVGDELRVQSRGMCSIHAILPIVIASAVTCYAGAWEKLLAPAVEVYG